MEWPAKSLDLNTIENLWGIIVARRVNHNGRQLSNVKELKRCIFKTRASIDEATEKTLFKSLSKSCVEVIQNWESNINY